MMTIENWCELEYYERAFMLGRLMSYMNNEDAYYYTDWLYIWPDGETFEGCVDDFGDKESYDELEKTFIRIYGDEEYHDDGLFSFSHIAKSILDVAHMFDNALGLKPIVDYTRK